MNSQNIISKTQSILDLLLTHDENCQNCCLRHIFKQIENTKQLEGQIPADLLTESKPSDRLQQSGDLC